MEAQLTKSLTDLIDETLLELEELRKSRFAATEITIEGPGDGIDGKPSDGKLDAKKAEDEEEDDKEEDEDKEACDMGKAEDEEEEEEEEAKKADSHDDPADSAETKRKLKSLMNKKEDEEDEEDEEDKKHPAKKATKEAAKEIEEEAKEIKQLHKSLEESESLMKSYVEERVRPLEDKLSTILDLVNKIADQPVAPKGGTFKAAPLFKSAEGQEVETLSKAQVASKLFELKKSGTSVDTLDIAKADLGQDLEQIVKKYKIS